MRSKKNNFRPSAEWLEPRLLLTAQATGELCLDDYPFTSGEVQAAGLGDDHVDVVGSEATRIRDSQTVFGRLENSDDQDVFFFDANVGKQYDIAVYGSDSLDSVLTLYADILPANVLARNDDGGSGLNAHIVWTAPNSGRFYFAVSSAVRDTGTYQVSMVEDDHSGTAAASATQVMVGETVTGEAESISDIDVFRFSAVAGNRYRIDSIRKFRVRRPFSLISQDGSTVLALSQAVTEWKDQISWNADREGEYYLRFDAESYVGRYQLAIVETPTVADDHAGVQSNAATPVVGLGLSGELETSGDVDVFRFYASEGDSLTAEFNVSEFRPTLTLTDAAGNTLAQSVYFDGGVSVKLPRTETYYLTVSDGLGAYQADVDLVADNHADKRGPLATHLPHGATAEGALGAADVDVFQFATVPKHHHRLTVNSNQIDLSLESSSGGQLVSGRGEVTWLATSAETHYLTVSEGVGEYALSHQLIEDDHANEAEEATPIAFGSKVIGSLEVVADIDVFAFETQVGRTYEVELELPEAELARIRVASLNGKFSEVVREALGQASISISWLAKDSDQVVVMVDGVTTNYAVEVLETHEIRDDHGDTFGVNATVLTGPRVAGQLETTQDVDVFRFKAGPGDGVEIRFEADSVESTTASIYNEAGNYIGSVSSEDTNRSFSRRFNEPDQTYFIRVGSAQLGRYELLVDLIDDDYANDIDSASHVLNGLAVGNIDFVDDVDYLVFLAQAGEEYTFNVNLGSLSNGTVRLFDTAGSRQLTANIDSPTRERQVTWTAEADGPIYLAMSGTTVGDYVLSIGLVSDDHADTVVEATSITSTSVTSGRIEKPDDVDTFEFMPKLNKSYHLGFRTLDEPQRTLRILATDGFATLVTGQEIVWKANSTAVRYVQVDGKLGDYELSITESDALADDHGNSRDGEATELNDGTVIARLETSTDVDVFAFDAVAGQAVNAVLKSDKHVTHQIKVFTPSGTAMNAGNDGNVRRNLVETGRYYAEVDGEFGEYEIKIEVITDDFPDLIDFNWPSPILANGTTKGTISIQSDVDLIPFNVTAESEEYKLEVTATTGERVEGNLLDPNGRIVRSLSTNATTAGLEPGRYFVRVSALTRLDYEVSVEQVVNDPGTPLVIGETFKSESEPNGERDKYSFVVEESKFYEIATTDYRELTLLLDDTPITDYGNGSQASKILWQAPASGMYSILVGWGPIGEYGIEVNEIPAIEDLHGDRRDETATPIAGESQFGQIGTNLDVDVFQVVLAERDFVNPRIDVMTQNGCCPQVALYDANGVEIRDFTYKRVVQAGTYYLEVTGLRGAYELSVTVQPDDHVDVPRPSATFVEVNSSVAGELLGGDVDVFAISAVRGAFYEISLETPFHASLIIHDGSGTELATVHNPANGRIVWQAPDDGTYFITVLSIMSGVYRLHVDELPTLVDDHSDLTDSSASMPIDEIAAGKIATVFDKDVFCIPVEAGQDVWISSIYSDPLGGPIHVSLIAPDGSTVVEESYPSFMHAAQQSGEYFLVVTGPGWPVTYRMRSVVVSDDHPDQIDEQLASLSTKFQTTGEIELPNDVDYFAFEARRFESFEIVLDQTDLPDGIVFVRTPVGNIIGRESNVGNEMRVEFVTQETGRYFAEVRSGAPQIVGSYGLRLTSRPEFLGDFSLDGVVDARDIDLLFAEIDRGTHDAYFDVDFDGSVTQRDAKSLVEGRVLNTTFGDFDLDGKVDFSDFLVLSKNFGNNGGWEDGDTTGDAAVDFADFLVLSTNFGFNRERV